MYDKLNVSEYMFEKKPKKKVSKEDDVYTKVGNNTIINKKSWYTTRTY